MWKSRWQVSAESGVTGSPGSSWRALQLFPHQEKISALIAAAFQARPSPLERRLTTKIFSLRLAAPPLWRLAGFFDRKPIRKGWTGASSNHLNSAITHRRLLTCCDSADPPTIKKTHSSETQVGRMGTLQCEATAIPTPEFEWYRDEKR